jgi:NAD(P)-dependent dehydrogenase (short-subunit alcohol dehydrogenase family)
MPSRFDLSGLVAVVTGGNRGIGFGIAESLAAEGADVVVLATDAARNAAAVAKLAEHGHRARAIACDVSDETAVRQAFESVVEDWGRLDACFANAGIAAVQTKFPEQSLAQWQAVTAVNLDGVFLTLREASRHMVALGSGGSLVVTSSLTAIQGAPRNASYAASKTGILGLVRTVAVELGRYGVRANAILPGWIETELTADMLGSDAFRDRVLPRVPAGRFGKPADIGAAAVFLASPESAYVNGASIVIDGAYSLF